MTFGNNRLDGSSRRRPLPGWCKFLIFLHQIPFAIIVRHGQSRTPVPTFREHFFSHRHPTAIEDRCGWAKKTRRRQRCSSLRDIVNYNRLPTFSLRVERPKKKFTKRKAAGEFRSLRRATRALPLTRKLLKKFDQNFLNLVKPLNLCSLLTITLRQAQHIPPHPTVSGKEKCRRAHDARINGYGGVFVWKATRCRGGG